MRVRTRRRGLQRRGLGAAERAQRARALLPRATRAARHAERGVWADLVHFWNHKFLHLNLNIGQLIHIIADNRCLQASSLCHCTLTLT